MFGCSAPMRYMGIFESMRIILAGLDVALLDLVQHGLCDIARG